MDIDPGHPLQDEVRSVRVGPYSVDLDSGLIQESATDTEQLDKLADQLHELYGAILEPSVDEIILNDRIQQLQSEIGLLISPDFFLNAIKESCANCLRTRLLAVRIIEVGNRMEGVDWSATRHNMVGYIALCGRDTPRVIPELNNKCDEEKSCKEVMSSMGCQFEEFDHMSIPELDQKAGELIVSHSSAV